MACFIEKIVKELVRDLARLSFGPPVSHVYNPLVYALEPHLLYWQRYGQAPKPVIFLGMNPGPWGMVQTGIPFGDPAMVRDWLGIEGAVGQPALAHPKRPVSGFDCRRSEVSGRRLWGWAKSRYGTAEIFFRHFWVTNYCPLTFMEAGGRNRTPDKLPERERRPLFKACDHALRATVEKLEPQWVVGVGAFAARRAAVALEGMPVCIGGITHPSPANPKANRGWAELVEQEMVKMGIQLPAGPCGSIPATTRPEPSGQSKASS